MKAYITIFSVFFAIANVYANDKQYVPVTGIRASYMGAFIYPGFKIGIEKPYKVKPIERTRREVTRINYKERYFSYSLGMYHHSSFHTNFFLLAEWNFRNQRGKGFFMELTPGIGLSRTILDGPVFRVDDSGNVSQVRFAGNFYGIAGISGSIGKNLFLSSEKPMKIFFKPSVLFFLPYNKVVYLKPTFEIGLVYSLYQ